MLTAFVPQEACVELAAHNICDRAAGNLLQGWLLSCSLIWGTRAAHTVLWSPDSLDMLQPPLPLLLLLLPRAQIVPTEYMSRWGIVMETNQYSVSEYTLGLAGQRGVAPSNDTTSTVSEPFVDFSYDLSPIMMTVAQSPQAMLHFVVRLCAVVGGVLSITRMADKLVHAALVATGMVVLPPSIKAKHRCAAQCCCCLLTGRSMGVSTPLRAPHAVALISSRLQCGAWLVANVTVVTWSTMHTARRSVSLLDHQSHVCCTPHCGTCLPAGPPAMQAMAADATATQAAWWTRSMAACPAAGAHLTQVCCCMGVSADMQQQARLQKRYDMPAVHERGLVQGMARAVDAGWPLWRRPP